MHDVVIGSGAVVRRAIIDKNSVVPPGARIGVDPEADERRFTCRTRASSSSARARSSTPSDPRGGMKVALLTREFPPEVYGGAGVHVEYLSRELARLVDVSVLLLRGARPSPLVAASLPAVERDPRARQGAALRTMSVGLRMAADVEGVDLVHSHTWYANFGGHLAKLLYDIPHVVTTHSLEPLRPWKAEQLGAGYALSSYCERTAMAAADAVIAVSEAMGRDILAAYPDVDPDGSTSFTTASTPTNTGRDDSTDVLDRLGIDPARPTVMFVGRITRQKGIVHLLDAAARLDPDAQLVLCAGAPDTPEIGAEIREQVAGLQPSPRRRLLDRGDAAPSRRGPAAQPRQPCSSAHRSTSRSG